MSRGISAANINAAQADSLVPVYFARMVFDSLTLAIHTGVGVLSFASQDYDGLGGFLSVSPIVESGDLKTHGLRLTLSGIDSDLDDIRTVEIQDRKIELYEGYVDLDDHMTLLDTPHRVFSGFMDNLKVSIGDETHSLILTCENRFARWDRDHSSLLTNADQQRRYPGDKGLEYSHTQENFEGTWGESATPVGSIPSAGISGRNPRRGPTGERFDP